jgi:exocyst complex component 2
VETFQRTITTATFRIAAGVDLSSSNSMTKPTKQNAIAPEFVSKITKAFLDVLYAVLDGLVHLAQNGSPVLRSGKTFSDNLIVTGTNPLELLDLTDRVCIRCF